MYRIFAAIVLVAVLGSAACGGGGNGGPTPTETFPPDFTPQPPGLLTPSPPPPVDGDSPLVLYDQSALPYSVSLPNGWTVEPGAQIDKFSYSTADKGLVAQLSVTCSKTLRGNAGDPTSLVEEDVTILRETRAPVIAGTVTELQIDGLKTLRWPYSVNFGPSSTYQWVYYIGDKDCTWRVRTVVFGTSPGEGWEQLFNRIAGSFHSKIERAG